MVNLTYKQYQIKSYRYGYAVTKLAQDDNGEFIFENTNHHKGYRIADTVGYYNSLNKALKGLSRYIIRMGSTDINDLSTYRSQLKSIEKDFEDKLDKVVPDDVLE